MANVVHIDPQVGIILAEMITKFCDVEVQETAQLSYDAVKAVGEDSNCMSQFKEKLIKIQNTYNNDAVPGFTALKAAFEEYTDLADYISKLDIDTNVFDIDAGTVESGTFDAARSL